MQLSRSQLKGNALFAGHALAYAVALLLFTGLVTDWGEWYSPHAPAYRAQSEALLRGELAVSRELADLGWDHTWSEQGVHQVWGLGVPLWRLPFEAVARGFGFDAFPDRIAFGLFALLVSFVVLKTWMGVTDRSPERGAGEDTDWPRIARFGAGFILLLLFPPFLTLLRTRGLVYEEAVAYEYLYGVLQLTVLVAFVRRPAVGRLLLVCALAGLGGLIRPTLVFHGFGTVVIAMMVWVFKVGLVCNLSSDKERGFSTRSSGGGSSPESVKSVPEDRLPPRPPLPRVLAPALLGLFLFGLGGGVLWLTNLKRFGDGFEFGHRLNVQFQCSSLYATRFDDPFQDEPLPKAARELFGALFQVRRLNTADYYAENIFFGQAPTVRLREFYFRTYDWSYLPVLLLGWGAAIAAGFKFWVSSFKLGNNVLPCGPPAVRPTTRDCNNLAEIAAGETNASPGPISHPRDAIPHSPSSIPDLPDNRPHPLVAVTLGLWSLLAALLLAAFYLYTPVISSRYMMDFAPAFAAAAAAAWLFLAARCERRWSRWLAWGLLCTWVGVGICLGLEEDGMAPASISGRALRELDDQRRRIGGEPSVHDHGHNLGGPRSGVPFDLVGWDQHTGELMPLVILFVKDAEFLELELESRPHPRLSANPGDIRAKVGLEFLERAAISQTETGWRVRFHGPRQPRWQAGVQSAFIATVPREFLAELSTPWVLRSVRWRANPTDERAATTP